MPDLDPPEFAAPPDDILRIGAQVARIALGLLLAWVAAIGLAWYVLDRIAAAPLPGAAYDNPIAADRPAIGPPLAPAGQASLYHCAGGGLGLSTADDDATPPAASSCRGALPGSEAVR
ncbi:hypothetical protein [Oceanibacterium hippocampi]|uniref:Uncharacterized protein n=1 Tax=Oceanibacterium hippocampi TaxID=745714 RepID=A0A1Y5TYZ8_9PROT|nr:hypothetical protein [Oceanibacterium hippocampi]SLN77268.1 hypothetical protein OCH7691_04361 [Oceanibacterium hippocampi]